MNTQIRKSYIGIGILTIVIGLMLLIAPKECIKVIVIALGIASIINGIYNLISLRNLVADPDYTKLITVRGIVSIVIGALALFLPLFIAGVIWTVMIYILAVYLLASALLELYGTTKMKQAGIDTKPYIGEFIGSILLAIILFLLPAEIGTVLVRILGIIIFLFGIGFLVWEWKTRPVIVYSEVIPNDPNDNTNN